jgi:hypothetical protein
VHFEKRASRGRWCTPITCCASGSGEPCALLARGGGDTCTCNCGSCQWRGRRAHPALCASLFREVVPAAWLERFRGILNSTTNLILTEMEHGTNHPRADHR